QTVEQVNAARARSGETHADSAGKFGVSACHERRGLLMPGLDEADMLLALAQRFHDAVDSIAGNSEDCVHTPFDQPIDQNRCRRLCHVLLLMCLMRGVGGVWSRARREMQAPGTRPKMAASYRW